MAEDRPPKKKTTTHRKPLRRDNGDLSNLVFGKVQPQALPLEESVLGALMLDKNALPNILDIIRPDSFYLDAHKMIYSAMMRLFQRSHPIDLYTVTEELRKTGELETIGGAYFLVELTNKVTSAANIEYHARIISQKHIQRELIRVSTQIIQDSYDETTDVFNLLDEAEKNLFSITEQNLSRGVENLGVLTTKALKQLEELKDKEDGLTGIPSGFTNLDRLTSGWQSSDLVIMAARPGMGKTALVLTMARNASMDFKKSVAIFSLEMSNLQLVQRLLSLEAEIPGNKLRNGKLEDYEWQQLHTAIEHLSEASIFIDDTPGINIFELRAKCRRLKMQHDIQMVVIDYLQLMSGGSDNQRGNREQEVSAISRSLKGMAKELDVPVIALSQLSRAVEVRGGDKRPQLSDLRESGCLTGDTLIQDMQTGKRVPIKDLAERQDQAGFKVMATNDRLELGAYPMVRAFYSGEKRVYELTTRTGRKIKASANHPFLQLEGWKALEDLKKGDRIAVPRSIKPHEARNPLSENELVLLAHLIGDGCIIPKQPYHYTSADPANIQVVNEKVQLLFGIKGRVVEQENWWHIYLKSPYQLSRGKKHPITEWYDNLGLERVRSYKKYLPEAIFECDSERISLFLHHLWATDGNISWKNLPGRKPAGAIYYASSSQKLVGQVQHLLTRLGILSTVRKVSQGKHHDNYHLQIQGKENQLKFLRTVGCFGERGAIIPELLAALEEIDSNPNFDVIPVGAWNQIIKPALKDRGFTQASFAKAMGIAKSTATYKSGISHARLSRINEVLESPKIENLMKTNILWDEIIRIEALGIEPVYDATVAGVHNFVANDIIVHNSIEQDADIVGFIYRPDYYQITEDEEGHSLKGVSEVIIAKHRHGATDTVKLRFIPQFAKFVDMEDPDFNFLQADSFTPDTDQSNIITKPSKMNEDEDIPF